VRLARQNDKDFMEVILLDSFDRPKPTVGCSANGRRILLDSLYSGLEGGGGGERELSFWHQISSHCGYR